MTGGPTGQGLKGYLPILGWLPNYKPAFLRFDLIAALSVWALLVPQGIAYAGIAGVPAQYGLYAALGALVGYALFGTAGQVITGPSAAIAAVSGSIIALWATADSPEWVSYTATLAVRPGWSTWCSAGSGWGGSRTSCPGRCWAASCSASASG